MSAFFDYLAFGVSAFFLISNGPRCLGPYSRMSIRRSAPMTPTEVTLHCGLYARQASRSGGRGRRRVGERTRSDRDRRAFG